MIHAATAAKAILTGFWSKPRARATKMDDTPTNTHVGMAIAIKVSIFDHEGVSRSTRPLVARLAAPSNRPNTAGWAPNTARGMSPTMSHSHPGTWLSMASTGANPHVTAAAATIAA